MSDVLVISNAGSGSSDEEVLERVVEALGPLGDIATVQPSTLESFDEEVRRARGNAPLVVVAGGDGTFNCSVNAFADSFDEVAFGLVPMGTGNDLARTLGLPGDPVASAHALARGGKQSLDVSRVTSGSGVSRLFVNACMGGFPVEVNEAIDADVKKRFGPLAFWVGGMRAASELTRYTIQLDGRELHDVLAVGVGNGRTSGGGVPVWPEADPSDGVLEACSLGAEDLGGALRLAAKVRSGEHRQLEGVHVARGARLVIEAEPQLEFNVDGELIDLVTPATFEIVDRLEILVAGH